MEHHVVPLARRRHLAAAGSRVPVMVLTAHGDDETRWRCFEAGATAFLEKLVRTPALLDAVRRALASTWSPSRQCP